MEEYIKLLEKFCEVFRNAQKSIDKYEREDYGEIIGQDEIIAIENLIEGYKELEKEYRILREYINFAPNLDEMSALDFKNIQEQSYLRGRNDENINYKNYVENNCIEKSKVIEIIENYYNEHSDTKEEITEFIEELLEERN